MAGQRHKSDKIFSCEINPRYLPTFLQKKSTILCLFQLPTIVLGHQNLCECAQFWD